jgi:DNA-binding IclR family transcriptional regulator
VDLAQATRVLAVQRSAAYRVLRSLESGGLLVYDAPRQSYRLSLVMARLGQVAMAGALARVTPRTTTDPGRLRAELARIRRRGSPTQWAS